MTTCSIRIENRKLRMVIAIEGGCLDNSTVYLDIIIYIAGNGSWGWILQYSFHIMKSQFPFDWFVENISTIRIIKCIEMEMSKRCLRGNLHWVTGLATLSLLATFQHCNRSQPQLRSGSRFLDLSEDAFSESIFTHLDSSSTVTSRWKGTTYSTLWTFHLLEHIYWSKSVVSRLCIIP